MNDFFRTDGPLFNFMAKAGQVIIASVLTIICCIPVVTIVPALSALYYGTIKTVRRDRGYIHKEYFRSFKHCLPKGVIFTIIYLGLAVILIFNVFVANIENVIYLGIYGIVLAVLAMSIVYLIPVLSRFNMSLKDMLKLSISMSIRHLPTTLLLVGGTVIVVYMQVLYLPVVMVLFLPGLWCYGTTFLVERVLKKYMAKVSDENDENTDTWYLE